MIRSMINSRNMLSSSVAVPEPDALPDLTGNTQDMLMLSTGKNIIIPNWAATNETIIMDVYPTNGNAGLPSGAPLVSNNYLQRIAFQYTGTLSALSDDFNGIIKYAKLGEDREYLIDSGLGSDITNLLATEGADLVETNAVSVWSGSEGAFTYLELVPSGSISALQDLEITVTFSTGSAGRVRVRGTNGTTPDGDFYVADGLVQTKILNTKSLIRITNYTGFTGTVTVEIKTPAFNANQVGTDAGDWDNYVEYDDDTWRSDVLTIPKIVVVNNAPVITMTATQYSDEEVTYQLTATTFDADSDTLTYAWLQTSGTSVTLDDATILNPSFTTPSVTGNDITLGFQLTIDDGTDSDVSTVSVVISDATPVTLVMDANTDFIVSPMADNIAILDTNGFHATLDLPQLYNVVVEGAGTYEIKDSVNALSLGTTRHTTSKIDLATKVTAIVDAAGINDDMSGMTAGYDVAINFSDHEDMGWGGMHWATVPVAQKGWVFYTGYSNINSGYHAASWSRDQLMFMKIQPDSINPEVVRLASNHNLYDGNYRDEAPAALNFTGTKLYWSSNFGGRIGHSEIFVIDIPTAMLSALENNTSLAAFNTSITQFTDDYGVGFPAKGESHVDANTGVSMKRLTDVSEFTTGGTTPNNAFIVYSRYTPENSDGSYVLAFGDNSGSCWVIDASTGNVIRELEPSGSSVGENNEVRWDTSGNFPNRVYYVKGMGFYMIEDVSTSDTPTLIRDFSSDVPAATKIYNDVEGNSTNDSNQWAWMASHYDGALYRVDSYLHYNISANTLDTMVPSDMGGSALDFISSEPYFVRPNMVEMALDGSGIIIHNGRKWNSADGTDRYMGTFFDGVHLWPTSFDYKTTAPLKVQISETHSGWAYDSTGQLGVVSQDNRLDKFAFVAIGQQALHNKVTDIDKNGRTVTLNAAQLLLNIIT